MNEDAIKRMLDKLLEVYDEGDALFRDHPIDKVLERLEPSQKRTLAVLVDVTYGMMKSFQYGMLNDETAWDSIFALALISFDIGKDAGR